MDKKRVRTDKDKECVRAYQHEVRRKHLAGELASAEGRTCNRCGVWKDKTQFTRNLYVESGLDPRCKSCRSTEQAAYAQTAGFKGKQRVLRQTEPYKAGRKIKNWARTLFDSARQRARILNRPFELEGPADLEAMWNTQQGKCAWFGIPMIHSLENKHPAQPSLERLDCAKGYVKGNVILVCWAANLGRSNTDLETWQDFCRQLRK